MQLIWPRDHHFLLLIYDHGCLRKNLRPGVFWHPTGSGPKQALWPRPFLEHIKYNLNFKNEARVFKFEIMDAIDTRIKNIKFLAQNCPKLRFFVLEIEKNKLLTSNKM